MIRSSSLLDKAGQQMLHWRWLIMLLMGLGTLALELIEHSPITLQDLDIDFVREALVVSLILPVAGGTMLSTLAHARSESKTIRKVTIEAERRRIARDLHDSLGQSLGYLHLKLDELTNSDTMHEIAAIQRELEQMRDVVDTAYEQLRGKLVDLRSYTLADLTNTLENYARTVGRRANFQVRFVSRGEPRPLAPQAQREILYLVREGLINAEKHADAREVNIELVWAQDGLTIKLADDGRGFDPDALRPNGHLGLAIMRERAREINGRLVLTSCPQAGTQLSLWVPLDSPTPQL